MSRVTEEMARRAEAVRNQQYNYEGIDDVDAMRAALEAVEVELCQGSGWTLDDAERLLEAWRDYCGDSPDGDMLVALNECFPRGKPVARELTDPVRELLKAWEHRITHHAVWSDGYRQNLAGIADELRTALAARDAQKAKP